jgi:DNA-binding SARP family transcriptional activator
MVELRILGPLEASANGTPIQLGGQKQRALLGLFLTRPGDLVPSERIIDELWGEHPPPTAATSLQNLVSQLRRLLGQGVIVTRSPGYVLEVEPDQVDHVRFERLVRAALPLGAAERCEQLTAALGLWRGPPYADLEYESFAQGEIRRLDELHLTALEGLYGAEIELGRGVALVPELDALLRANPLREGLCAELMLALCAAGRQGEAIRVYLEVRERLADELGIDPSPALEQTYRQILRQEDAVFTPAPGPPPDTDTAADVAKALLGGRLVPVLGWGASAGVADALEATPEAVADRLCRAFDCSSSTPADLARICEEVALTAGIGPLYDELRSVYEQAYPPGPAHRLVAEAAARLRERGLPPQVLVTATFDGALERTFTDAGEELDVVSYIAYGAHHGKFLHVRPDGSTHVIEVPNTYADLAPDKRTVLLRIHGRVDPREPDLDSFVVSEDDHIDYLAQADVSSLIPASLIARLRRSHFLFLGYPLEDWGLRVFLHRIWGRGKVSYRSWAVGAPLTALERELWRQRGVRPVEQPLDGFVEALRVRLTEAAP